MSQGSSQWDDLGTQGELDRNDTPQVEPVETEVPRRSAKRTITSLSIAAVGVAALCAAMVFGGGSSEAQFTSASRTLAPSSAAENPVEQDSSTPPALAAPSSTVAAVGSTGAEAVVASKGEVPTQVIASSIGLDAPIDIYGNALVAKRGGVDPSSLDRVAWWSGGGSPSAASTNTVYLYGHTWYKPAIFNDIHRLAKDADITVRTKAGDVHYRVTDQYVVDKSALPSDGRVTAAVPGRLLLIGCYRERGDEKSTTQNIVVVAQAV